MATARAIVTRGSLKDNKWNVEDVYTRPLRDDELLVRMVASGVCFTDLEFGEHAGPIGGYPRILGHEGVFPKWRT